MDIKVAASPPRSCRRRWRRRARARLFILGKMLETIDARRAGAVALRAAHHQIKINPDKIGDVIGPGGKMIRTIIEETKCHDRHRGRRHGLHRLDQRRERQEGDRLDRGADQGRRGRRDLHRQGHPHSWPSAPSSRSCPARKAWSTSPSWPTTACRRVEDVVNVGDEIKVMVTEIDRLGRINLSRRALLEPGEGAQEAGEGRRGRRRPADGRRPAAAP